MPEDATQVTGAQGEQSIVDRIAGILDAEEATQETDEKKPVDDKQQAKPDENNAKPEGDESSEEEREDGRKEEEGQEEEVELPRSLRDLADRLGLEYDKFLESIEAETKIDGEEGTVSLAKLLKSYQLDGHLNRKLMEQADAKRAFEQEAAQKRQAMDQHMQELATSLQLAQTILNQEFAGINWTDLEQNNVQEFLRLRAKFQDRQNQIAQASLALQRHQQFMLAEQQHHFHDYVEEQKKQVSNKIPEWRDDKVRSREQGQLREFLKEMGYSEDEIKQVVDHRWVLILRDAMKYRELQKKKPAVTKRVAEVPKLTKPGAPRGKDDAERDSYMQQRKKLKDTGKIPAGLLERFV